MSDTIEKDGEQLLQYGDGYFSVKRSDGWTMENANGAWDMADAATSAALDALRSKCEMCQRRLADGQFMVRGQWPKPMKLCLPCFDRWSALPAPPEVPVARPEEHVQHQQEHQEAADTGAAPAHAPAGAPRNRGGEHERDDDEQHEKSEQGSTSLSGRNVVTEPGDA